MRHRTTCPAGPAAEVRSSGGLVRRPPSDGRGLQPLVDIVDKHGTMPSLEAVSGLAPESRAEVTVSTAHKAKGREWPCVTIADDFTPPKSSDQEENNGCAMPGLIDDSEARLAYVAVTRTRRRLDMGACRGLTITRMETLSDGRQSRRPSPRRRRTWARPRLRRAVVCEGHAGCSCSHMALVTAAGRGCRCPSR